LALKRRSKQDLSDLDWEAEHTSPRRIC
jgi:hypothetical protein